MKLYPFLGNLANFIHFMGFYFRSINTFIIIMWILYMIQTNKKQFVIFIASTTMYDIIIERNGDICTTNLRNIAIS